MMELTDPSWSLDQSTNVQISVVRDGPDRVWVSLHNPGAADTIRSVRLETPQPQQNLETSMGFVFPLQTKTMVHPLGSKGQTRSILVHYEVHGISNTVPIAVEEPSSNVTGANYATLIPALISFAGVIIGAWLLHRFTRRRDRDREKSEWRRYIFDKYEEAYREFLSGWGGTPSAVVLSATFSELRRKAIVPQELVAQVNTCKTILENSDDENKKVACEGLYRSFVAWLTTPDG